MSHLYISSTSYILDLIVPCSIQFIITVEDIININTTVTNGPVSVTEKGPAHSSAMGAHWGWCFFSLCRFL